MLKMVKKKQLKTTKKIGMILSDRIIKSPMLKMVKKKTTKNNKKNWYDLIR